MYLLAGRKLVTGLLGLSLLGSLFPVYSGQGSERPMILGPEDQLSIKIADFDELPDKPLQVDSSGYLQIPGLGRIKAQGLTTVQLQDQVSSLARKYMKEPRVSVVMVGVSSQPVSVFGAVSKPGVYQLAGPKTLVEVLSMAGGLRPDAGSMLTITRDSAFGELNIPGKRVDMTKKYETADIDLDDLVRAKIPTGNIMIEAHDIISVPKADLVYVVGRVRRPGGFPILSHEKLSLLQGLALAEGLDAGASPKNARILRPADDGQKRVEIPVNISALLKGNTADVSLRANDVLFVPSNTMKTVGMRAAEVGLQLGTGLAIYRR